MLQVYRKLDERERNSGRNAYLSWLSKAIRETVWYLRRRRPEIKGNCRLRKDGLDTRHWSDNVPRITRIYRFICRISWLSESRPRIKDCTICGELLPRKRSSQNGESGLIAYALHDNHDDNWHDNFRPVKALDVLSVRVDIIAWYERLGYKNTGMFLDGAPFFKKKGERMLKPTNLALYVKPLVWVHALAAHGFSSHGLPVQNWHSFQALADVTRRSGRNDANLMNKWPIPLAPPN